MLTEEKSHSPAVKQARKGSSELEDKENTADQGHSWIYVSWGVLVALGFNLLTMRCHGSLGVLG